MSERSAFIRAICENPACDTARLVFADWLDENGNGPWARFIRHQIWTPVSPCRLAPLTALLSLEPFVGPLPHLYTRNVSGVGGATVTYPNGMEFWFRRGFVAEVHLPCHEFLKHAAALFAAYPITSVILDGCDPLDNEYDAPADRWFWIRAQPNEDPRRLIRWEVPYELCADARPHDFDSTDAAYEWLSQRCVAWGRAEAKLSPLTFPNPIGASH